MKTTDKLEIGKWVCTNILEIKGMKFADFEAQMPQGMVGIYHPTVLQTIRKYISRKSGLRIELNNAGMIVLLRVRKDGDADVDAVPVVGLENSKYNIDKMLCLPEFYNMPENVQEYAQKQIKATSEEVETLTAGIVSQNTSLHVAQRMCKGVRMNTQGGTYFIPEQFVPKYEEYVTALENFLGKKYVQRISATIERDEDGIRSVKHGVENTVYSELQHTMKLLGEMKTNEGRESRLVDVLSLMELADMYKDILKDDLSEVDKVLNENRKTIEMLMEI